MFEVREYLDEEGRSPFAQWFLGLTDMAGAARITSSIDRMRAGNLGDHKSVGGGVFERRVDFGPGYRVYFAREGSRVVLLLGGGTKKRQAQDIETARQRWANHRRRAKEV